MAKYRDKNKSKAKPTVPFREHEYWKDRHERRFVKANTTHRSRLESYCAGEGLSLSICNNGEHWIIRTPEDPPRVHLAQWWPRSAKLIIRCQWKQGIHCHCVGQVIAEIEQQLAIEDEI